MTAVAMTQAAAARAATRAARMAGLKKSDPAATAAALAAGPSASPTTTALANLGSPLASSDEQGRADAAADAADSIQRREISEATTREILEKTTRERAVAHASAEAVSDYAATLRPSRTVLVVTVGDGDGEGGATTASSRIAEETGRLDAGKGHSSDDRNVSGGGGNGNGFASFLWGLPGGMAGWVLGQMPSRGRKEDPAKAPPEGNTAPGSGPSTGSEKLEAAVSTSADGAEAAAVGESVPRSWWQFLTGWVARRDDGGEAARRAATEAEAAAGGAAPGDGGIDGAVKPVEAIIIPPDLPIEEIAM